MRSSRFFQQLVGPVLLAGSLGLTACQSAAPAAPPAAPAASVPDAPAPAAPLGMQAPLDLTGLYEQAIAGVVNINVRSRFDGEGMMQLPEGIPPELFPNLPQQPDAPQMPQFQYGQGSGFVWDEEGHIVTNYHVVRDAEEVIVTFSDLSTAEAEVVGTDPDSDLAVLKVKVAEAALVPLPHGDSAGLKVGQPVAAIGNPFGLSGTMTTGIISAKGRVLPNNPQATAPSFSIPDVLQTDAAINPGNSGGPLLDLEGQVIGVNFQIQTSSGVSGGIGFAIPIDLVKDVVPELIEDGSVSHAWLGIQGRTVTPTLAEALELPIDHGAQVMSVVSDGPADEAGLRGSSKEATVDGQPVETGGDLIVAVDGTPIHNMDEVITAVSHHEPGDTMRLTIQREGESKSAEVTVTLGERPQADE